MNHRTQITNWRDDVKPESIVFIMSSPFSLHMFDACLSGALRWKEDLARKAMEAHQRRQRAAPNLRKLVYGTGERANHKRIEDSRQAGIYYKRHG